MTEIWAQKYRPTLIEIVGQDDLVDEMWSIVDNDGAGMQHFLFHSPEAGTGKTSVAYALADELGWPIHVFNASSKKTRGIEFVEDELLPLSTIGNYKQIFLLDEADQLTPAAQSALKGVIENAQGYFILTCNNTAKVSRWLKSRCSQRRFKPIDTDTSIKRLRVICSREGERPNITLTNNIENIVAAHPGDLRNAINALQAYCGLAEEGREAFMHSLTDAEIDCALFLRACFLDADFDEAYNEIASYEVRPTIQQIFAFATTTKAGEGSKLKVIDAAITSERDLLSGVDENIVRHNFVRLCIGEAPAHL